MKKSGTIKSCSQFDFSYVIIPLYSKYNWSKENQHHFFGDQFSSLFVLVIYFIFCIFILISLSLFHVEAFSTKFSPQKMFFFSYQNYDKLIFGFFLTSATNIKILKFSINQRGLANEIYHLKSLYLRFLREPSKRL